MIIAIRVLCVLAGILIATSIDSPKKFFAKGIAYPIVGITLGVFAQTAYEAGIPWTTLIWTMVGFALIGVVMYYIGMFLITLLLHRFLSG